MKTEQEGNSYFTAWRQAFVLFLVIYSQIVLFKLTVHFFLAK